MLSTHCESTLKCELGCRMTAFQVVATMTDLHAEVQPILEIVQNPGRVSELRQEKLFTQVLPISHVKEHPASQPWRLKRKCGL